MLSGGLIVAIADVLKAGFVDYVGAENLGVAELYRVLLVQACCSLASAERTGRRRLLVLFCRSYM